MNLRKCLANITPILQSVHLTVAVLVRFHKVECCHMANLFSICRWGIVLVVLIGTLSVASAQQTKDDEIPGAIKLKNGLILRGICSSGHSLSAGNLADSRLDLRKIDQGFRVYYVATRQSDPIVADNLAIPDRNFEIIQRTISHNPMNFEIGLHKDSPFAPDGTSSITLQLAGGQSEVIQLGIMGIDSRFAKVRGLTHRWIYGVSIKSIPDATLYADLGLPCLLRTAKGFDDGETRLNMVQMLMEAEKYTAARLLLTDTQADFPELEQRCQRLTEAWNDQVGDRVLAELNLLKETGKHETARNYARNWPDGELNAVIRFRARQFLDVSEEEKRAVESIAASLNSVLADLDAPDVRRGAMQMCSELLKELNVNTLPQLSTYELLWQDPGTTAQAKIALAVTGWLLGAENAIDEFPEAFGLFQTRFWLMDYLQTDETESAFRDQLIERIRSTEGFTVDRLAQLIQRVPPDGSITVKNVSSLEPQSFEITEDASPLPRCVGLVPREYDSTRKYPLIIAFARGGGSSESTLAWWSPQAERNGFVVAVPEIYAPTDGQYDASASQHRMMLNLITRLKAGLSIDDDRVFIAGHGIGAQAAIDIATAHPDLFAGVVSLAGLGRNHFLWTADNSVDLPWYVVAGTRQPSYGPDLIPLLRKLFTRVPARGRLDYCNAMLALYPERGFESYAEELPDLFRWMQLQKRPDYSDRISATTLRSTDLSWFWLELDSISGKFVSMDEASTPDDRPAADGHIEADISGNRIRIKSLPGNAKLRISNALPEVDLEQPISISRAGRTQKVEFSASTRDLLEDFRIRRDRTRLCFMKVAIE